MIRGLGVEWAGTLLGCIAILLVPMPIFFYLKGGQIRQRSVFAPTLPIASNAAQDALPVETERQESQGIGTGGGGGR